MSPRKPTIDGLDDNDDEDGSLEEEKSAETDLTPRVAEEDQVGLGRTPPGKDPYIEDPPRKGKRKR